jgi:ribosome-associated protein
MELKDKNFEREFTFRTSRSSGKGGQHVNTTETKVELVFDVQHTRLLNEEEKQKLIAKLSNRVNEAGELSICSSQHRSQLANKEHVIKKFFLLLEKALRKEKKRIPTSLSKKEKEENLKRKKLHSVKKELRRVKPEWKDSV